jgi:quercetin dioxygenase-like cupin family protein
MKRLPFALGLASIATAVVAGGVMATPGSGFSSVDISKGRFSALEVRTSRAVPHEVELETEGDSEFYVVENTVTPGGLSGWHTHPGPSLVTVKSGTATFYDGDDASCTPIVYETGRGFIDRGDGHVHMVRNEGDTDLVLITVQLFPAETPARRIDVPAPTACGF